MVEKLICNVLYQRDTAIQGNCLIQRPPLSILEKGCVLVHRSVPYVVNMLLFVSQKKGKKVLALELERAQDNACACTYMIVL